MHSSLDTIEYLARSEHRVEVLDAICTAPKSRDEIRDMADASRVTVGRILADLEERGWIVRTGKRYEATPRGRFVAAEFIRLACNLESFERLPPVVEWVPGDQPTFDLRRLADATVVTAGEGDLIAPIRRALDLLARSETVRTVANSASPEFIEATRDAVVAGRTHSLVVPPETIDAIRADSELRSDVRTTLESGRASLYRYGGDGELPVLQIGDGTVALCSGDHRALVETEDATVYDWAESYFESLRTDATPVGPEAFADGTATARSESETAID